MTCIVFARAEQQNERTVLSEIAWHRLEHFVLAETARLSLMVTTSADEKQTALRLQQFLSLDFKTDTPFDTTTHQNIKRSASSVATRLFLSKKCPCLSAGVTHSPTSHACLAACQSVLCRERDTGTLNNRTALFSPGYSAERQESVDRHVIRRYGQPKTRRDVKMTSRDSLNVCMLTALCRHVPLHCHCCRKHDCCVSSRD